MQMFSSAHLYGMDQNQQTLLRFARTSEVNLLNGKNRMKRYVLTGALLLALAAIGLAQNVKLTFSGVTYPDGREGTIQASVKTTGNGSQLTVCTYFSDPNEQFLGQYQSTTNFSPVVTDDVKQFCLAHFGDRQSAK
jgi:hypothetical protein